MDENDKEFNRVFFKKYGRYYGFIVMAFFVFLFIKLVNVKPNTDYNDMVKGEYRGEVTWKYIDSSNHREHYINVAGQEHRLFNFRLYDSIKLGDTVIKNSNDNLLMVIKKNKDTIIFNVDRYGSMYKSK